MTRCLLALLAGMSVAYAADDRSLYESNRDLQLGPLFLTPAERLSLEARRRLPAVDAATASQPVVDESTARAAAAKRPAAGFIVSSSGRPLVWIDGEFREVDRSVLADLRFPGAVRVRKSPGPDTTEAAPDGDAADHAPPRTSDAVER